MLEYIKQNPNLLCLIMTGSGQILTWAYDILQRDAGSRTSPVKFSLKFYLKDNYIQLPVSIVIALIIALVVNISGLDYFISTSASENATVVIMSVLYLSIGVSPTAFFTWIKRTSKSSFLRPDMVKSKGRVYNRK